MFKKLLTGLLLAIFLVGAVALPSLAATTVDDYTIVDGVRYLPGDEIAGLRDQYSQTFYEGEDRYSTRMYLGSIHYEDGSGNFQSIDTTIAPSSKPNWDWEVETGHWQLFINNDTTVGVKKDGNWGGTRFHGIAYLDVTTKDYTILQTANTVTPVVSGNTITWYNILYGVDYVLYYTNDSLKEDIVIHQEARDLLSSVGHRPSDYGYAASDTYLVPIFECDWSQSLPMKLVWEDLDDFEILVEPDEIETNRTIYFEAAVEDQYFPTKLVSFLPVYKATSVNPINPEDPEEEWEYAECVMKKRLVKKNDKHWLLTGVPVLELNAMPQGSIIFDPTETLRPSGSGDSEELGPGGGTNWSKVDEESPDELTTVIYGTSTSPKRDLYTIPAHSEGSGIINSIRIYFRIAIQDGIYIVYARPAQKSGVTVSVGGIQSRTGTTTFGTYSELFTENPATSNAYTWGEIDALQIGLDMWANDIIIYSWCTQVYVVVDYTLPVPPTVTTQAVSDIATTTATGNGNITATGGEDCDIRGIVWDLATHGDPGNVSPAVSDYANDVAETPGPYGIGAFTRNLTSLPPGDTIYCRAYAHNSAGYSYGGEVSFNTLGPPSVTTNAASLVEETTATLNGEITAINGANATVRGFEWDIDTGTPYAFSWEGEGDFGVGVFDHGITGLTKGELYYYRAYATNTYGTGYGNEVTFLTKPDLPTSLDAVVGGATQVDLTWVKGPGAQKTYIRGEDGSYPTDRTDGYLVYNDTLELCSDTGLIGGHTYYYRAWSYATEGGKEQYSDLYDQDSVILSLTLKLWYQPNAIISGTVLIDRQDAFNGIITWGGRLADSGSVMTLTDSELTQADNYWNGYTLKIKEVAGDAAPEGEEAEITDFTLATLGGTADSGTNATLVDATLTQTTAYWAGVTVTIVTTTDGEAPQGESKVVATWDLPTNTLTFPVMTAVVDTGDTYTLTAANTLFFDNLTAVVGADARYEIWDGQTILWGSFPAGIKVGVGALVAYTDPVSEAVGLDAPEVVEVPPEPGDLWGEDASSDLPLYELFNTVAAQLDWETSVLYVVAWFIIAIGLGVALLITTGSGLGAIAGVGAGLVGGMATGMLPVWVLLVYLVLGVTWLYTSRAM